MESRTFREPLIDEQRARDPFKDPARARRDDLRTRRRRSPGRPKSQQWLVPSRRAAGGSVSGRPDQMPRGSPSWFATRGLALTARFHKRIRSERWPRQLCEGPTVQIAPRKRAASRIGVEGRAQRSLATSGRARRLLASRPAHDHDARADREPRSTPHGTAAPRRPRASRRDLPPEVRLEGTPRSARPLGRGRRSRSSSL
jgi:hypothetical protein